jgi:regulator of protease activity HflC (stomatin/prohibitin superfamily)
MFAEIFEWLKDRWNDLKPIMFINPYEGCVQLRAGRYLRSLKGGNWYWKIPFIDDYHIENVQPDTIDIAPVTVTTLDNKTATIGCEIEIQVTDVRLAVLDTNDWRTNIKDITRGILSEHLEDCNWEEIKKKVVKNQIMKKLEKRFQDMGITLLYFNYTDKSITRAYTLLQREADVPYQDKVTFS